MNQVFKQVVRKKMTEITPRELIEQAKNYQINLTDQQANQIVHTIQSQQLDPFKKENLAKMLKQLEQITDKETVKKAKIILNKFIKQYNIQDWFS